MALWTAFLETSDYRTFCFVFVFFPSCLYWLLKFRFSLLVFLSITLCDFFPLACTDYVRFSITLCSLHIGISSVCWRIIYFKYNPVLNTVKSFFLFLLLWQARIKKIMQADEDVGKIALAVPVLVCKFWQQPVLLVFGYWCSHVVCKQLCYRSILSRGWYLQKNAIKKAFCLKFVLHSVSWTSDKFALPHGEEPNSPFYAKSLVTYFDIGCCPLEK